MISRFALVACGLLSTMMLAWVLFAEAMVYPAIALVVLGILWTIAQLKWKWLSTLGFAVITLLVILGVIFDLPPLLLALVEVSAFIAWDLAEFHSRIKQASRKDEIGRIEKNHFFRLGSVLAAGVIAALIIRFVKVRFSFEVGVLLVLAGIWGVSLLVGRLRQKE